MPPESSPAAWVLLRHDLPSGDWHFDWLLERPGRPDAPLVSFRTLSRPDLDAGPLRATRTPDHRRAYLTYEGEVSGDRGRVSRIASGVVLALDESPRGTTITLDQPRVTWFAPASAADDRTFSRT